MTDQAPETTIYLTAPDGNPIELAPRFAKQYNISLKSAARMLVAQRFRCMICGELETATGTTGKTKRLAQDHDHGCCPEGGKSCGKCTRSFLCESCNKALGEVETYLRPPTEAERTYLRMWQLVHAGVIPFGEEQ